MPLPPSPFSTAERNLLRHEFLPRFGQVPSLPDGIRLKVWRGGPQAGQPKVPAAVASMLNRGLVEIGPGGIGFRAHFTPPGSTPCASWPKTAVRSIQSNTPKSARSSESTLVWSLRSGQAGGQRCDVAGPQSRPCPFACTADGLECLLWLGSSRQAEQRAMAGDDDSRHPVLTFGRYKALMQKAVWALPNVLSFGKRLWLALSDCHFPKPTSAVCHSPLQR